MSIQERDSKGRFSGLALDPETVAAIAADNVRARKIVKVCDSIGIKPEEFGVKQWEGGNWHIDYYALLRLSGLALGLALALNKPPEETKNLLLLTSDALGYLDPKDAAGPAAGMKGEKHEETAR